MQTIFSRHRFITITIGLLLALASEYYFSYAHEYLIPITTLIVMTTSIGNMFIKGLQRFLLLAFALIIFSFVTTHQMSFIRFHDVTIGAIIGILANLIIFPKKADKEFRAALFPILIAYENYFIAIIDLFLGKPNIPIENQKIQLEQQLQKFPFWIYDRSFDYRLQTGYRYFLGKIEAIAEILFAMHYTVRQPTDKKIIKKIKAPLMECVVPMQVIFKALITVFELKKLSEGVEDCQNELYALEHKLQSIMPDYLELIDLPREFSRVYEFVYILKDLRNALIKLAQALR